MFLLDLGLTAKNMHSIMPCPLPPWLELPQMPDNSSEHNLPFCTCSLRSPSVKIDTVQLFSRKPYRKVIPLRTHVPHRLTWQDTVFSQEKRRLGGLHSESVENWALFQENIPLQQRGMSNHNLIQQSMLCNKPLQVFYSCTKAKGWKHLKHLKASANIGGIQYAPPGFES